MLNRFLDPPKKQYTFTGHGVNHINDFSGAFLNDSVYQSTISCLEKLRLFNFLNAFKKQYTVTGHGVNYINDFLEDF